MDGYLWAIAGLFLVFIELLTTSFFAIFLGAGALMTALLTYLGITTHFWSQILVFSVFSVLSILLLRRFAKNLFGKESKNTYSEYVGDKATVEERIEPNKEGKVFYRGTVWIAFSDEEQAIDKGSSVIITEVDGIKLKVKTQDKNNN